MALANEGMLAKYIAGIPAHPQAMHALHRRLVRRYLASNAIDINPDLVEHIFVAPLVRRIAGRLASPATAADWGHRADAIFDWFTARQVKKVLPNVVVCYENAAIKTFRVAKQLGITTVLDAASFHHVWQDRFCRPVESPVAHERVKRNKGEEIRFADFILTASELAKQSYYEAGICHTQILSNPVGVETSTFTPGRAQNSWSSGVRFVYVGNISRLKGIDVLGAASQILNVGGRPFDLTIIGNHDQCSFRRTIPSAKWLGKIDHNILPAELRKHDVLILPSRFDSFGMVVAEAMACGLPAIVTENVGAKQMIKHLENGLIIPAEDAPALATAMEWFIANRRLLPSMSQAARNTAEDYDWAHYHRRAVSFFASLRPTVSSHG